VAFVVNSEPRTGARPSARLCVGPELAQFAHKQRALHAHTRAIFSVLFRPYFCSSWNHPSNKFGGPLPHQPQQSFGSMRGHEKV